MEELFTDILIIGGGLAGITSALEADGKGLNVLVVGKFSVGMGTNTSMANGAFSAANPIFSKEEHLRATLESGRGLNHLPLVQTLVENGPGAIEWLRDLGVPIIERGNGYWIGRPDFSSDLAGVLLVKALMKRLQGSSVRLLPGLTIFDLIVEEGHVRGAFGFFKSGKPCLVHTKAVLLAAGGAGAIYRRNDNQRTILGDGYALAFRAGLPVFDLEFVQFYPLVLAEPRLSTFIILPPYPKEARLMDETGKDLLEQLNIKEDLNWAIVHLRDRFSIFLYEASRKGDVYFDLTRVPEERWDHYPLNFLRRTRFPFRERPFLVSPAVHFFMGGIETDDKGRTSLPGLFAAGEVVWGVHGANRLGGNALTECVVFGRHAGESTAEYALQAGRSQSPSPETLKKRWERRAKSYTKKKRGVFDHPEDLLMGLKDLAWKTLGPVRDEGALKEGLALLASLEQKVEKVYPQRVKDLFKKKDLENTLLLLRAILQGSLLRTESRGSFFRKDFPEQDDSHWLKNTCYRLEGKDLQITHRPVTQ